MKELAFKVFKTGVRPFIGKGFSAIPGVGAAYQYVARKLIPDEERIVTINGYKMHVRTGKSIGGIAQQLIFDHVYEPLSTKVFVENINLGDTVVDVGANIGYYTLLAASRFCSVYAFEPEYANYVDLVHNISLNSFMNPYYNVMPMQSACSDTNCMRKLYVSKDEAGAHSLEPARDTKEFAMVKTVRLDDVIKGKVGFIKIDTEGHEMAVLAGAKRILSESMHTKMLIECWEQGLVASGSSVAKMLSCLNGFGFSNIQMVDEFDKRLKPASACSIQTYTNKHKFSVNLFCTKE
jgi:FkbM family methyltransferase